MKKVIRSFLGIKKPKGSKKQAIDSTLAGSDNHGSSSGDGNMDGVLAEPSAGAGSGFPSHPRNTIEQQRPTADVQHGHQKHQRPRFQGLVDIVHNTCGGDALVPRLVQDIISSQRELIPDVTEVDTNQERVLMTPLKPRSQSELHKSRLLLQQHQMHRSTSFTPAVTNPTLLVDTMIQEGAGSVTTATAAVPEARPRHTDSDCRTDSCGLSEGVTAHPNFTAVVIKTQSQQQQHLQQHNRGSVLSDCNHPNCKDITLLASQQDAPHTYSSTVASATTATGSQKADKKKRDRATTYCVIKTGSSKDENRHKSGHGKSTSKAPSLTAFGSGNCGIGNNVCSVGYVPSSSSSSGSELGLDSGCNGREGESKTDLATPVPLSPAMRPSVDTYLDLEDIAAAAAARENELYLLDIKQFMITNNADYRIDHLDAGHRERYLASQAHSYAKAMAQARQLAQKEFEDKLSPIGAGGSVGVPKSKKLTIPDPSVVSTTTPAAAGHKVLISAADSLEVSKKSEERNTTSARSSTASASTSALHSKRLSNNTGSRGAARRIVYSDVLQGATALPHQQQKQRNQAETQQLVPAQSITERNVQFEIASRERTNFPPAVAGPKHMSNQGRRLSVDVTNIAAELLDVSDAPESIVIRPGSMGTSSITRKRYIREDREGKQQTYTDIIYSEPPRFDCTLPLFVQQGYEQEELYDFQHQSYSPTVPNGMIVIDKGKGKAVPPVTSPNFDFEDAEFQESQGSSNKRSAFQVGTEDRSHDRGVDHMRTAPCDRRVSVQGARASNVTSSTHRREEASCGQRKLSFDHESDRCDDSGSDERDRIRSKAKGSSSCRRKYTREKHRRAAAAAASSSTKTPPAAAATIHTLNKKAGPSSHTHVHSNKTDRACISVEDCAGK
ncbi:hypothetical protein EDD11_009411 [Mortierella claussenii]|nr:hypothetical protein EDD11_009411 [Mortierella claussenii]